MYNSLKAAFLAALTILISGAIPALSAPANGVQLQEPLRIGAILPLTGALAEYGLAVKNAFELALEQNPSLRRSIRFLYEDSGYDNKSAILAYQKLKGIDKADLIYLWGYGPVEAVAPIAEKDKYPLIAVSAEKSASLGRKYVIRFNFFSEQLGEILLAHLRGLGYRRFGIIKVEQAFINGIYEGLKSNLRSDESLEILDIYSAQDFDFRVSLAKIAGRTYDAFGVLLLPGQISAFFKQSDAMRVQIPFFGTHYFESRSEIEQAGSAMTNSLYPGLDASPAFRELYMKRFGNDSRIGFAASAYDFAHLAGKLFPQGREAMSNEEILDAMKNCGIQHGATGDYYFVDNPIEGPSFRFPISVKSVDSSEKGNFLLNSRR